MSHDNTADPESPIASVPLPSAVSSYVGSEVQYWNGKALHPFDVMRRSAAYVMGLRYDRWRESDLKEWSESGIYSNLPNDVVIVLFVCSTPKESKRLRVGEGEDAHWEIPLTVPKIFSDPEAALTAAYAWAEKENVDFSDQSGGLAVAADIFLNIMRQIDAGKHKAIPKNDKKTVETTGEVSPNELAPPG